MGFDLLRNDEISSIMGDRLVDACRRCLFKLGTAATRGRQSKWLVDNHYIPSVASFCRAHGDGGSMKPSPFMSVADEHITDLISVPRWAIFYQRMQARFRSCIVTDAGHLHLRWLSGRLPG